MVLLCLGVDIIMLLGTVRSDAEVEQCGGQCWLAADCEAQSCCCGVRYVSAALRLWRFGCDD